MALSARGIRPQLLDLCCEHDSMLTKVACRWRWDAYRVTQYVDFCSQETLDWVVSVIHSKTVAWYSSPCTGGSQLQRINALKGKRARQKIRAHKLAFARMWRCFCVVVRRAIEVGALICIEWPKSCEYWHENACLRCFRRTLCEAL